MQIQSVMFYTPADAFTTLTVWLVWKVWTAVSLLYESNVSALCVTFTLNNWTSRTVTLRQSDSPAVISAATKQFFCVCDLSFIRQRRKNLQKERENNMRNAKPKSLWHICCIQAWTSQKKVQKKITFCRNYAIVSSLFQDFYYCDFTFMIIMLIIVMFCFNSHYFQWWFP